MTIEREKRKLKRSARRITWVGGINFARSIVRVFVLGEISPSKKSSMTNISVLHMGIV